MTTPISPGLLRAACSRLFAVYQDAVDLPGREMIIAVPPASPGVPPGFYVLVLDPEAAFIGIRRWGSGDPYHPVGADLPGEYAAAITAGVPVPIASLYGWADGKTVTALISVVTWDLAGGGRGEAGPPVFSVLPAVDLPERDWPPAVSLGTFGWWWWDFCHAGFIVRLAPLIADTSGVVTCHIPTTSIGVHMDLESPGGWKLPSGVYACHTRLREGLPLSRLSALHADPDNVEDVAPGLQREASRATAGLPAGGTSCPRR